MSNDQFFVAVDIKGPFHISDVAREIAKVGAGAILIQGKALPFKLETEPRLVLDDAPPANPRKPPTAPRGPRDKTIAALLECIPAGGIDFPALVKACGLGKRTTEATLAYLAEHGERVHLMGGKWYADTADTILPASEGPGFPKEKAGA